MNQTTVSTVPSFSLTDGSVLSQVGWIAVFSLATAIGAQIEIPHHPVPFTLQTLFVLLAGAFLGMRNGALSQMLYVVLGVLGLPVFSGFGSGIGRIIGPTGGYLLSFPFAALAVGYILQKKNGFLWSLGAMTLGLLIIFSLGTIQLYAVYFHDWSQAFVSGFLIFSWWDLLKLFAASSIYSAVRKTKSN